MVRAYTSYPWPSRPNQASADGASRALERSAVYGSVLVKSWGNTAIRTNTMISTPEIQNIGRCRSSSQASLPSERAFSPLSGVLSGASGSPVAPIVTGTTDWVSRAESRLVSVMRDPRIQEAVQDVDDEVDQEEDQHQTDDGAHHRCPVLLADAAVQEAANAIDVEHPLGNDGPAHQRADIDADVGDDRDQGIA